MSIIKDISSTVKNIFNADDDMVFDDDNDFSEEPISAKSVFQFGKKKNDENSMSRMPLPSFDATNHGLNMPQSNTNKKVRSNGRIQVYVPKTFEEAFNIIKDVKNGFTAMVNVEIANPQVSQRIIDLISGAIYALDGDCKKMGEKQYIFSLSTETVGAYDYLPVNGVKTQDNSQFNFNMGQPFDFLNQNQNMQQNMQQQMMQQQIQQPFNFNPQQQGFTPQPNFNQQLQNFNQPVQKFNPQPPISQF